jgi:hypothetical protein
MGESQVRVILLSELELESATTFKADRMAKDVQRTGFKVGASLISDMRMESVRSKWISRKSRNTPEE